MFGNEADRIARERAQQQKRQEEQARNAKRQEIVVGLNALVQEIEAEIPMVLRLEAERGYPGVEEVRLTHKPNLFDSLFGPLATSPLTKGGWKVGEQKYDDGEGGVVVNIYLLSDGRLASVVYGEGIAESPRHRLDSLIHQIVHSTYYSPHSIGYGFGKRVFGEDGFRSTLEGLRRLRNELEAA